MSSDDLPQKCQEQVCAILFAAEFFFIYLFFPCFSKSCWCFDTDRDHCSTLKWMSFSFRHADASALLRGAEAEGFRMCFSLTQNKWLVCCKNQNTRMFWWHFKIQGLHGSLFFFSACVRSLKYKSHYYHYCCQILSKDFMVCKVCFSYFSDSKWSQFTFVWYENKP